MWLLLIFLELVSLLHNRLFLLLSQGGLQLAQFLFLYLLVQGDLFLCLWECKQFQMILIAQEVLVDQVAENVAFVEFTANLLRVLVDFEEADGVAAVQAEWNHV